MVGIRPTVHQNRAAGRALIKPGADKTAGWARPETPFEDLPENQPGSTRQQRQQQNRQGQTTDQIQQQATGRPRQEQQCSDWQKPKPGNRLFHASRLWPMRNQAASPSIVNAVPSDVHPCLWTYESPARTHNPVDLPEPIRILPGSRDVLMLRASGPKAWLDTRG